jgi:hypothetical protein
LVEGHFDGDTFFPVNLPASPDWEIVHEEAWPADAKNAIGAKYVVLNRRDASAPIEREHGTS